MEEINEEEVEKVKKMLDVYDDASLIPTFVTENSEGQLLCIGTWDVNHGYDYRRILDLMIKGKLAYLSIQESTQESDLEQKWAIKITKRHLRDVGFDAVDTKHNIVVF